jgi:peptidoglycan hydrolase-like protein with peptidoglycan-binding domain
MTRRRTTLIVGAIATGVAITALVLESGGGSATASGPASATATAAVIRTTLASRQEVPGTLERAGSYTLVVQRPTGTITWLPGPGTVIRRGQVLYRIDGQPVRLLFGAQAAWRRLARRVLDGADVRQLKRSLMALGFTAYGALTVDDHFDWATAVAIKQWQRANGVAQTGVVPLGSVAFLPGAVRVTAQRALPGTPAQPGTPVLDLSSTDLVVNVPLDPSLRQLVHVGDRVQIQLPEGQNTAGRVGQIAAATAATSAPPGSSTSAGAGATGPGAGGSSSQGSAGPSATVPVTISLEHPGAARGLDQVPVQVGITDTVRHHVLAVPIAALLALAQGGYAVAVEHHGTRTLIAVTPGVFDGGRVQVTSSQLRPGMRVEVPSS